MGYDVYGHLSAIRLTHQRTRSLVSVSFSYTKAIVDKFAYLADVSVYVSFFEHYPRNFI